MFRKNFLRSLLICFVLAALLAVGIVRINVSQETTQVIFLDVDEGDAILISRGGNQILIDGGRSGKELLARLGRHIPFWDRTIEIIIATHPDADHIGGFPSLLRAYRVGEVFSTGAESDTETSRLFQEAIVRATGSGPRALFRGAELVFPSGGGTLIIEYPLGPLPKEAEDTNAGSIVARFIYGETSFLLTGDLPAEETVLAGEREAAILKVAHHGSKYSTSAAFLDLVRPEEAVISVGRNSYGHPNEDVLQRLSERGIRIRRTDSEGDIRYRCASHGCASVR